MTNQYINRCAQKAVVCLQVLAIMLLAAACRKTEHFKFSTDLAIDSRTVVVAANATSTRFIVYSDGSWNAQTLEEVSWMNLKTNAGSGKGEVVVEMEDNTGNLPRAVKVLIKSGEKTDTISLRQRGVTPIITIADATAKSIANGGVIRTPINTNVPLNLMEVSYRYVTEGQTDWVSDLTLENGYLYFRVGENKSPEAREGVLKLSYLDALGTLVRDSIVITQNQRVNYDNAVLKDFAYVKGALAAGVIQEDIYIEGIVISDKGNPNMAKNLNSPTNKHVVDKTENAIAVYVQSLDGTQGLYLKTKSGGDNMFNLNERVKIWLKDAVLEKFTNPSRVIVKDIGSLNIMSKEESTAPLQPREKHIRDLTDEDLYTYVKLKDVEISVPHGSFFNINEGYNARTDCYPTNLRDIHGNSLNMLLNMDVPYRRDGNRVPQGSGDISGILVYETLERYGGNIGRYAIRPLKREEIALNENRSDGFSNVLVEWSRFRTEFRTNPTAAENPLTPEIGTGVLRHSAKAAFDYSGNGIYATQDFNGLIPEATTNKGAVANGAWGINNWWNATTNKGHYMELQVSTAGITQPISLQIEGHTDIGGPRNFVVEWAGHNNDAGIWNTAGTFTFEDLVTFGNTLLTQVPGFKVVNMNFPIEASGLDKLYIRIRTANKNAGTATSNTGGTVTAAKVVRIAHVSIKYNK